MELPFNSVVFNLIVMFIKSLSETKDSIHKLNKYCLSQYYREFKLVSTGQSMFIKQTKRKKIGLNQFT